jgi:hypothetical protein
MSVMTPASGEWITGLAARRLLQCSYGALQRLAVLGQVKTQLAPGVPVRYRRSDVEAIAATRTPRTGTQARPDPRGRLPVVVSS